MFKRRLFKLSFLSLAIIPLFFLFGQSAKAASSEAITTFDFYCIRHGFNASTYCSNNSNYFHDYFDNISVRISMTGHRHGSSEIRDTVCVMATDGSTGTCYGFTGTGDQLGPEYGGDHPFNLFPGGCCERTLTINDPAHIYQIFISSYVKDAEVRAEVSAFAIDNVVRGCTNPAASNYNPSATQDDGNCYFPVTGCRDPLATNYNPYATVDGPCDYTTSTALRCGPTWQTVNVGQSASFSVAGGNSGAGYTWNANDGSPSSGSGTSFSTSYAAIDSGKTVRVTNDGVTAECYVAIVDSGTSAPINDPCAGGACDPPVTVCGDGAVNGGESCDLGGGNGACPSECSSSCTRNSCVAACELSQPIVYTENTSYLSTYGRRLENGTCYRGEHPVATACILSGPSAANQGIWANRGNNNDGTDTQHVCNADNLCYGCDLGTNLDWSEAPCERRYACNIDNGASVTVDMQCNGSNGPCTVNAGDSATLSWAVTNKYNQSTTCTASGDWSGAKASTGGTQSTGALSTSRTYNYVLTCSNAGGTAVDSVNVVVNPTFDYTLSNSGSSGVIKTSGNTYTQNIITAVHTGGTSQPITLSLSGVPSGVSYSVSPGSCTPGCYSTINFTVSPSTAVGTYPITVTGSPVGRQTTFDLVVSQPSISVACTPSAASIMLGQSITWTGVITGGTAPFTYSWSGTSFPTSPAPATNPYTHAYSTIGTKTAQLLVQDADGSQVVCPAATARVNFSPFFEEF